MPDQSPKTIVAGAQLKAVCDICGKPVAGKAKSDVTRYLSAESRCNCLQANESQPPCQRPVDELAAEERSAVEANLGERYQVLGLLGRGGMGNVYKVHDRQIDKTLAIKVLNQALVQDAGSVKRFEQEARAASSLTHANLAAVYDYGVGKSGSPFIVMDYLDGETLGDILQREGFLDAPRALDLFIQVVEAIAHAHMKGVIHRDIKPNNIMVEQRDGVEIAKLVDFGIAKVMPSEERQTQMTQTGEVFGSPLYMSPEQCLGNKLDARSDIYEMGCVMYEALTGIAPFNAENAIKIILRHVNEDAASISSLKQDFAVPQALELVVMRCLEREATNRHENAQQLLQDLVCVRDGKPLSAKRPVKAQRKQKSFLPRSRFERILAAALSAAVLLAGALIGQALLRAPASAPPVSNAAPGDPYTDAQKLDQLSYAYFSRGDYERAIPLLEFGVKTYKQGGSHMGNTGGEDTYLADNEQHIGKCYFKLNKPEQARKWYQDALGIYRRFGNYNGSGMGEAVRDYADVLRALGQDNTAKAMQDEFARTGNLSAIP